MKDNLNCKIESEMKVSSLIKLSGLIRWSLIRHKYFLPTVSIIQAILAIAIVWGLALMIPQVDVATAMYLSSGAITLGIIAVGCVLAPQIISDSKQNGMFAYQRTLPVPRICILLADIIIWGLASLPGVIAGCMATILRFDMKLSITPLSVAIVLLAQITMICIGFAIAYWLPPNMIAVSTQFIMIGGFLFSPILYPAERLPEWVWHIHQILPFVPVSNLIRHFLFHTGTSYIQDIVVVFLWTTGAFILSLIVLSGKE